MPATESRIMGCGQATYEQVISQPVPESTQTFEPVSNKELLDMTVLIAEDFGLHLVNPKFGLARKGERMIGMYTLKGHEFLNGQIRLTMVVINSCDKSRAVRYAFGSEIVACLNGCIYSTADENGNKQEFRKKHINGCRDSVYKKLHDAIRTFEYYKQQQEKFFSRLIEIKIGPQKASHTIVEAARYGALNKKDIIDVVDEWEFQRNGKSEGEREWHPEFQLRSAYSLFNAFTQHSKAFQDKNPVEAINRSLLLTEFFNHEFSLN